MGLLRNLIALLARIFISSLFLISSIYQIIHWHESESSLINSFSELINYFAFSEDAQQMISLLIVWTPALLIISTLIQVLGGILILFGIREKVGAFLLILFLVPSTLFIHPFWFLENGAARELQLCFFLKNLSLLGALLLLLLHGGGGGAYSTMSSRNHPS